MPIVNAPLAKGLGTYKVAFGSGNASSGSLTVNTGLNTVLSVVASAEPVTAGDYAFATVASISGGSVTIHAYEAAAASAPAAGTTNLITWVAIGY